MNRVNNHDRLKTVNEPSINPPEIVNTVGGEEMVIPTAARVSTSMSVLLRRNYRQLWSLASSPSSNSISPRTIRYHSKHSSSALILLGLFGVTIHFRDERLFIDVGKYRI